MVSGKSRQILPVSELRDDAELRSNLFSSPLRGRESIARTFGSIETVISPHEAGQHDRVGSRDFIRTKATLDIGLPVEIVTVCLRDDEGWIYAASMQVGPSFVAGLLANRLAEILAGYLSNEA